MSPSRVEMCIGPLALTLLLLCRVTTAVVGVWGWRSRHRWGVVVPPTRRLPPPPALQVCVCACVYTHLYAYFRVIEKEANG